MDTIGLNAMATKRHVKESQYSYFDGNWGTLVEIVREHFPNAVPGETEGCLKVSVPPDRFFAGVVPLKTDSAIGGMFHARVPEEEPVMIILTDQPKAPARSVEIILYSRESLLSKNFENIQFDWEIISINASPTEKPTPAHPTAMARNQLGLVGGSPVKGGIYTPEQWAESVWFWAQHANVAPIPTK